VRRRNHQIRKQINTNMAKIIANIPMSAMSGALHVTGFATGETRHK